MSDEGQVMKFSDIRMELESYFLLTRATVYFKNEFKYDLFKSSDMKFFRNLRI